MAPTVVSVDQEWDETRGGCTVGDHTVISEPEPPRPLAVDPGQEVHR
ncbi:hypothetical protein [Streptomyces sp. NPDC102360]